MRLELTRIQLSADVQDAAVYAALPLGQWLDTEQGRYCRSHFQDLRYHISPDIDTWGYLCVVYADVPDGPELVEYLLRWP